MNPLEATVQLMQTWSVTGLLKGRTPEELRGDAISLCVGLSGAIAAPKRERKPKAPGVSPLNSEYGGRKMAGGRYEIVRLDDGSVAWSALETWQDVLDTVNRLKPTHIDMKPEHAASLAAQAPPEADPWQ